MTPSLKHMIGSTALVISVLLILFVLGLKFGFITVIALGCSHALAACGGWIYCENENDARGRRGA